MSNNYQKTGFTLFCEELEKRGFKISEKIDISKEKSGIIEITNCQGHMSKENLKKLSEIYGNLSWFHLTPEEAIKEMVDLLVEKSNF